MENKQDAPILSAIEQKPIRILKRMQHRAQVRLEKDQTDSNRPPMVHDSVTNKNCDVADSGESLACRKDLLKQIQLLETHVKEQQDQYDTLQVFHEQQCDQADERMIRTLEAHEEQIKARDYKINCLKKEKAANYSKHEEKAREEVKEEMKACDTANAYLRGKLKAEKAKVKRLNTSITQSNGLPHEGNSQGSNLQAALSDGLHLEVNRLKTALRNEKKANTEAQSKVVSQKGEIKELKRKVKNLDLALNEERRNRVPQSQFTALQKEKAELQKERDKLRLQCNTIKSGIHEKTTREALRNDNDSISLREQEEAKEVALRRVERLEKEAQYKKREIKQLKSALSKKTVMTKEKTQCPDKSLTDKTDNLQQVVKMLRSTLSEEKRNRLALNEYTSFIKEEKAALEEERDQLRSQVSSQKSLLREKTLTAYEVLRKVKTLEEERAKPQAERDVLCLQDGNLESALLEKDTALKEAQGRIKTLEEEKGGLQSSVENLKTALSKQQRVTKGACSKVTEQEQEIQKQKATAQALEQNLKSARDLFKTMVERFNAKFSAALAEKKNMEKKAQDLRQETERLTVDLRKKVSALLSSEEEKRVILQCKIQELSDALKASKENNSALLTHNHELQETIRTKEEQIQETENRRKQKKKWFGRCFGR